MAVSKSQSKRIDVQSVHRGESQLLEIIRKHPGLNGAQLRDVGFRPGNHPGLNTLEKEGKIVWEGGWHVVE